MARWVRTDCKVGSRSLGSPNTNSARRVHPDAGFPDRPIGLRLTTLPNYLPSEPQPTQVVSTHNTQNRSLTMTLSIADVLRPRDAYPEVSVQCHNLTLLLYVLSK